MLCPVPLRQLLSLNMELGWQPARPNNPPGPVPHSDEVIEWAQPHLASYVGTVSKTQVFVLVQEAPIITH